MPRPRYFINLANQDQVALYEGELKGQLSDGLWENSFPSNHWHTPCQAKAICDKSLPVGVNFLALINYDFTELADYIAYRMILLVKGHRLHPDWDYNDAFRWDEKIPASELHDVQYSEEDLYRDLSEISETIKKKIF